MGIDFESEEAARVYAEEVAGETFSQLDVRELLAYLIMFLELYNEGLNTDDVVNEIHGQVFRMGVRGIDKVADAAVRRKFK